MPVEHRNEITLRTENGLTLAKVAAVQTGRGFERVIGTRYIIHNGNQMVQFPSRVEADKRFSEILTKPSLLTGDETDDLRAEIAALKSKVEGLEAHCKLWHREAMRLAEKHNEETFYHRKTQAA